MTKTYRQGQILKLIRSKKITTQEELAHELKEIGIAGAMLDLPAARQVQATIDLLKLDQFTQTGNT